MDVLMLLGHRNLPRLEIKWQALQANKQGGLTVVEFTTLLLSMLPKLEEALNVSVADSIAKLFQVIDVDGDGTLEWQEFSEHCIELGEALNHEDTAATSTDDIGNFTIDPIWHAPQVRHPRRVRWLPNFGFIAVCEAHSQNVKLFRGTDAKFIHSLDATKTKQEINNNVNSRMRMQISSATKRIAHERALKFSQNKLMTDTGASAVLKMQQEILRTRELQSSQGSEGVMGKVGLDASATYPVVDVVYCDKTPTLGCLVTISQDLHIRFWWCNLMITGNWRVLLGGSVHTRVPQATCHWCPCSRLLFTGDVDGRLTSWKLPEENEVGVIHERRKRHSATVTQISTCEPARVLVTTGMDRRVMIWKLGSPADEIGARNSSIFFRFAAELRGHSLGVNAVDFSNNGDVIMTGGFDHQLRCWSGVGHIFLCKLTGHRAPICGIQVMKGSDHAHHSSNNAHSGKRNTNGKGGRRDAFGVVDDDIANSLGPVYTANDSVYSSSSPLTEHNASGGSVFLTNPEDDDDSESTSVTQEQQQRVRNNGSREVSTSRNMAFSSSSDLTKTQNDMSVPSPARPEQKASSMTTVFITGDKHAIFRVWLVSYAMCVSGSVQCLQTFSPNSAPYMRSFTLLPGSSGIVMSGFMLKKFQMTSGSTLNTAPQAICYNVATATFAVALGRSVLVFDATAKGDIVRSFVDVTSTEISTLLVEQRGRKITIGTQSGQVQVLNYANGAPMKSIQCHRRDVTASAYIQEHNLIVTTSWDKRICVLDEFAADAGQRDHSLAVLRSVTGAHSRPINCLAVSLELSLVATACSNYVQVWDFQTLVSEAILEGHRGEVTALSFAGSRIPALIVADSSGQLMFWPVRPRFDQYQAPVCVVQTGTTSNYDDVNPSITALAVLGSIAQTKNAIIPTTHNPGGCNAGARSEAAEREGSKSARLRSICNEAYLSMGDVVRHANIHRSNTTRTGLGSSRKHSRDAASHRRRDSSGGIWRGSIDGRAEYSAKERGEEYLVRMNESDKHTSNKSNQHENNDLDDTDNNMGGKRTIMFGEGQSEGGAKSKRVSVAHSKWLCVGDESGQVSVWDIGALLHSKDVRAIDEHKLPSSWASFNPKRRCDRHGGGLASKKQPEGSNAAPLSPGKNRAITWKVDQRVKPEYMWQAHTDSVKMIENLGKLEFHLANSSEGFGLATTGEDKQACVWSHKGSMLGMLNIQNIINMDLKHTVAPPRWKFPVDSVKRHRDKRDVAEWVLEEAKAKICLDLASLRKFEASQKILKTMSFRKLDISKQVEEYSAKQKKQDERANKYQQALRRIRDVTAVASTINSIGPLRRSTTVDSSVIQRTSSVVFETGQLLHRASTRGDGILNSALHDDRSDTITTSVSPLAEVAAPTAAAKSRVTEVIESGGLTSIGGAPTKVPLKRRTTLDVVPPGVSISRDSRNKDAAIKSETGSRGVRSDNSKSKHIIFSPALAPPTNGDMDAVATASADSSYDVRSDEVYAPRTQVHANTPRTKVDANQNQMDFSVPSRSLSRPSATDLLSHIGQEEGEGGGEKNSSSDAEANTNTSPTDRRRTTQHGSFFSTKGGDNEEYATSNDSERTTDRKSVGGVLSDIIFPSGNSSNGRHLSRMQSELTLNGHDTDDDDESQDNNNNANSIYLSFTFTNPRKSVSGEAGKRMKGWKPAREQLTPVYQNFIRERGAATASNISGSRTSDNQSTFTPASSFLTQQLRLDQFNGSATERIAMKRRTNRKRIRPLSAHPVCENRTTKKGARDSSGGGGQKNKKNKNKNKRKLSKRPSSAHPRSETTGAVNRAMQAKVVPANNEKRQSQKVVGIISLMNNTNTSHSRHIRNSSTDSSKQDANHTKSNTHARPMSAKARVSSSSAAAATSSSQDALPENETIALEASVRPEFAADTFNETNNSETRKTFGESAMTKRQVSDVMTRVYHTVQRFEGMMDDKSLRRRPVARSRFSKRSTRSLASFQLAKAEQLDIMVQLRRQAAELQTVRSAESIPKLNMHGVDLNEHKRSRGFGQYNNGQVTRLAHVFYEIDRNCSGHVDRKEFVESGMWEKYNMGSTAGSLFDSMDDDESNSISLDELVAVVLPMATYADRIDMLKYCNAIQLKSNVERYALITKRFPRPANAAGGRNKTKRTVLTAEELEELKGLFNLYDSDGNGTLDMEEMQDIFAFYPDSGITKEDLNAMYKRYGKTKGEGMTLDEFTDFMRASYVDNSTII